MKTTMAYLKVIGTVVGMMLRYIKSVNGTAMLELLIIPTRPRVYALMSIEDKLFHPFLH